jgi:protoporphyrinogen oxidase
MERGLHDVPLVELIKRTHGRPGEEEVFNNAAQTWNHDFYWQSLAPPTGKSAQPKQGGELARLIDESFGYILEINPQLTRDDLLASKVGRLRYAQPLCEPGFAARIPPIRTPIEGLQIADTCFYYPEDRGISEGARLAGEMAMAVGTDHQPRRKPVWR